MFYREARSIDSFVGTKHARMIRCGPAASGWTKEIIQWCRLIQTICIASFFLCSESMLFGNRHRIVLAPNIAAPRNAPPCWHQSIARATQFKSSALQLLFFFNALKTFPILSLYERKIMEHYMTCNFKFRKPFKFFSAMCNLELLLIWPRCFGQFSWLASANLKRFYFTLVGCIATTFSFSKAKAKAKQNRDLSFLFVSTVFPPLFLDVQ